MIHWKCDKDNNVINNRFTHQRKKFKILFRKTKKDFYYNKFNNCIEDSREVLLSFNEITGKNTNASGVSAINDEGKKNISDATEIPNSFNQFSTSIGSKLADDIEIIDINFCCESASQSMYLADSSLHENISINQNLKPKQNFWL